MLKRIATLTLAVLVILPTLATPVSPQRAMRLIRDAEIENTIRAYANPLFSTAGLDPNAVSIYLIDDRSLNAFVAGGQNMFFHTGLLMRSEHAGQVIGVMAHETGHIAGGHLTRFDAAVQRAQIESVVALVLAGAAAVLSGQGAAAGAVMGAGQDAAMRNFLKYSRTQESAADQFAVNLLDDTGTSCRGMLEFFEVLQGQEFLVTSRQDPYVRSHPLTSQRVDFVRNHVAHSRFSDAPLPAKYVAMHKRMRAKLVGFLEPTPRVYQRYKESDNSLESRYARAIARHRDARTDDAVRLVDSLIAEHPRDPYFHELKGQILFESGRIDDALGPYQKSVQLLPREALLRSALAAAQLETNDPALLKPALLHLKEASRMDAEVPRTWRLLAIAYGRLNQKGMMVLSLAEEAIRINRIKEAVRYSKQATEMLPKGSPGWVRAQDMGREAQKLIEAEG